MPDLAVDNTQMSEKHWKALIYAITKGNCILMLGPDASFNEENKPFINILADKLRTDLNLNQGVSYNLFQIAEKYIQTKGFDRTSLEIDVTAFYQELHQIPELYTNLATLPFQMVITSAQDDLILKAFQQRKKPFYEYYNFSSGAKKEILNRDQICAARPLIYNLNGSVSEPESLVLTDTDLLEFFAKVIKEDPALPACLTGEFKKERITFLFLGFGFNNWHLRMLLHFLEINNRNCSFAFETSKPESNTIFFYQNGHNIQIFDADLNSFVKELCARYTRENPEAATAKEVKVDYAPTYERPTVFLCHANDDKDFASMLYSKFKENGLEPWLDKENLRGGDRWDELIEKTINRDIDYLLVLQSRALRNRLIGYVNKEIKWALRREENYRAPLRFVIPLKIDDCEPLDELANLQTIDLSDKNNLEPKIAELVLIIKRDQEFQRRR